MFDGGIRSGQDVLRALALGARSCLIGRAFLYGLGAGGQAGVARAIEIIGSELDVSMALTGTRTIGEIGPHVLVDHHLLPHSSSSFRDGAQRRARKPIIRAAELDSASAPSARPGMTASADRFHFQRASHASCIAGSLIMQ